MGNSLFVRPVRERVRNMRFAALCEEKAAYHLAKKVENSGLMQGNTSFGMRKSGL
jgi:hypothetical protein